MILIVASEVDEVARSVASSWSNGEATVMTPRDMCRTGWRLEPGRLQSGTFVASEKMRRVTEISGVITLLPFVFAEELVDIQQPDRQYVSAELTALMQYFLTNVETRVVNRPGPHTLYGPDWRQEQWVKKCGEVGLPVAPSHRNLQTILETPRVENGMRSVVVVGDKCVGEVEPDLEMKAVKLAARAGVTFLQINLNKTDEGERFHSAYLSPNLSDAKTRGALQEYFSMS